VIVNYKNMIEGILKNNEQDYRAVMLDSSSSLKDFSLDRRKYFKHYIANEDVKDDDNQAIIIGKLVETLLWEPHLFDDKFYMSACAEPPTGLMLKFVEALYQCTREATDDEGNVTRTFEDMSKEAYEKSGYKLPYATIITKFSGSGDEIYYKEALDVRSKKLTVVTAQDVTNAENIVNTLKSSFVTKDVVNMVDSDRYTVLIQHQMENFEIDGHPLKSMMDLVIIDHKEQTIQVYDLKCTWAVENFYSEYYLYRRAYIQAYVYYRAMKSLADNPEEEYCDYTVFPPKFIVSDSINYYSPLIYSLSLEDLKDAYEGFEHNGRKYSGVRDIIKDLQWAMEMNIWNISRENYINNGVINIKGEYERKIF